jgi:uncharacterized membrane protein
MRHHPDHPHHKRVPAPIRLFFKGLATIIPLALTLIILGWLGGIAEGQVGPMIRALLPEGWYVRGMGMVAGVIIVMLIGLLSQVYLFRKLIELGEAVLEQTPVVKSIYRATKDFVDYFSGDDDDKFNQMVMVRHPSGYAVLGFITREDFTNLPFGRDDEVAVYLPLSYQIAGYTLFVPRSWCEPVDMPFEDGLRLILTAAMSRRKPDDRRTQPRTDNGGTDRSSGPM